MNKRKREDGYPRAVVRRVGGQLVLDDPDAVAMIHAVEKRNCRNTLKLNADRVAHFKNRLAERGVAADQVVIVLLNVDDVHGGLLANTCQKEARFQLNGAHSSIG